MSNALYIQSGGPTAVINSTAYGVISACQKHSDQIGRLYAAEHGLTGVISGLLYDLSLERTEQLKLLEQTPSMVFGSCRHMVSDEDCEKILDTLRRFSIRYIFMNGGNGSVRGCLQLYDFLARSGYDCRIIEIPKTVDNDISRIDHAPGFPSAARHLIISISELVQDMQVYDTDLIMVAEVMGRNSGYLAASTLAAGATGFGPDLIYVPETVFEQERFIRDISEVTARKGKCFAVVSEGVKDHSGHYLFEGFTINQSKNPILNMGGITPYLSQLLRRNFSCKIRCIDMGLMQRCAAHNVSPVDQKEAALLGENAVLAALDGISGKMISLRRFSNHPYRTETVLVDLKEVAASTASLPLSYINSSQNGIDPSFLDYILPLVGNLPQYASLKKIVAQCDA